MEGYQSDESSRERDPKRDREPFRSLLLAAEHLTACAADEEQAGEGVRATTRSTRVLVKLIEGWCIDQAVKSDHAALAGLLREQRDDTAVLAALRCYVDGAGRI